MYNEEDETHRDNGDQYKTTKFDLEIDSHYNSSESNETVYQIVT